MHVMFVYLISIPFIYFMFILLVYKFILSDYFYKITGIETFYMQDDKKKATDNVNILFSTSVILMPISEAILIDNFLGFNIVSLGFLVYSLMFLYLSICLFIRIYVFPFDDEKDIENRVHSFTYTSIALRFNIIISIFTVIFAMFYIITNINTCLYCTIISLIYAHILTLLPDYLNKYWFVELRTKNGMHSFYLLNSLIMTPLTYILIWSLR